MRLVERLVEVPRRRALRCPPAAGDIEGSEVETTSQLLDRWRRATREADRASARLLRDPGSEHLQAALRLAAQRERDARIAYQAYVASAKARRHGAI
jgi:hypothetical protein